MERMRTLLVCAALTLTPAIAQAQAEVRIGLWSGNSFVTFDGSKVRGQIVLRNTAAGRTGRRPHRHPHIHVHRPRHHHRPRVLVVRERHRNHIPDPAPPRREEITAPDPRLPDPRLPDPQLTGSAVAEPVEPLDPSGSARMARAPAAARPPFAPGSVVPAGTPHVTLDPDRFGLPRPPEGEIYARVRGHVLRISRIGRRIMEVVAP